jgi:hypothetical protein
VEVLEREGVEEVACSEGAEGPSRPVKPRGRLSLFFAWILMTML